MGKGLWVAGALVLALSACAQPGGNGYGFSKSTGGAILGGAGGALAGSQFGGGKGKIATTALGTLLGAWLGSEAGASMDRADQNYTSNQQRGVAQQPYGYAQQPQIQWSDPRGYDAVSPRY
ncbi:MAG: glycine zipper 2TM domain-containing protein [Magnetospirillum sp.]